METRARAPNPKNTPPGVRRAGIGAINGGQHRRRWVAIEPAEQKRSGGFENGPRSRPEEIGETHQDRIVAFAHGQNEIRIRVELDDEARGAALAAEAREHAMAKLRASGDRAGWRGPRH